MTVAIDRPRSGDSGARAAARKAEVAALRAADLACDAYRATLDVKLQDTVRPDRVVAVVEGAPGDALGTAVADLGSAAFAAARATHLAVEAGSEDDARRTGEVAAAAAAAAEVGATALSRRDTPGAAVRVVRLAHAAAMVAHLSADALEAFGAAAPSVSLSGFTDRPAVPFPASWRHRIERLSRNCTASQSSQAAGDELHTASVAACSAAQRALHVYARTGHGTVVARTVCRVTRIAALAACYAGVAALEMRASTEAPA
jgi:hypothetical protein